MRFMTIVKFNECKGITPPQSLFEAVDQLGKDAAKAGCVMTSKGGLLPTSEGARVKLAGGKVTVIDGPFTEAKEIIGGFAIFEAQSKAQIMEWTMRFMELHKEHMPGWEGETEVRQLFGDGDEPCGSVARPQEAAASA
jgi:hypothetical protein